MSLKPMFARVAGRYDLVNSVLTWGLDESWRAQAANECGDNQWVADLACGTGDMTLHLRRRVGRGAHILSIDFSKEMLRVAKLKVAQQSRDGDGITHDFVLADASRLPLRLDSLDCIAMSFAFRNLTYRNPIAPRFLGETFRVLKPSSRFIFVETSQPRNPIIRTVFRLYMQRVVPSLGKLLSGQLGPYAYLGYSAAHYPGAQTVIRWLRRTGFRRAGYRLLVFGVVGVFSARK